jgi:hypothetical protein
VLYHEVSHVSGVFDLGEETSVRKLDVLVELSFQDYPVSCFLVSPSVCLSVCSVGHVCLFVFRNDRGRNSQFQSCTRPTDVGVPGRKKQFISNHRGRRLNRLLSLGD